MSDFQTAKVKVKQGWLRGSVEDSLKVFKGIPYAAPPVGERRFRAPEDPGAWRGVRDATRYSAASIQHVSDFMPDMARSQYEEDCLYLNVWTPAKAPDAKLPVFMWIHGGGLVAGSGVESVCEGTGFASRKDIVVVTINYRLGFFGFFVHPELTAENSGRGSGNYALLDMRKAAMWIKENIAAFGGDPDNVTIAGQSGGAAAVGTLLVSPMMAGLAKHVSIESGPIFWGFMQPPKRGILEQRGVEFMKDAGCSSIAEMRRKDAWELNDLADKAGFGHGFSFCIDGEFLPDDVTAMMERGEFNDFDVLMGNCSQEFSMSGPEGMAIDKYMSYLETNYPDRAADMKKWYPAQTPQQAAKQAATISSDIMLMGSIRVGQLCAQYGKKAFLWLAVKENENEEGAAFGCPHCAEMPFVFGRVDTGGRNPFAPYKWVKEDYAFMDLIQGYWYNFALTGDPNGKGLAKWDVYNKDFTVIELGNDTHMITSPDAQSKYAYYYGKLINNTHLTPISLGSMPNI